MKLSSKLATAQLLCIYLQATYSYPQSINPTRQNYKFSRIFFVPPCTRSFLILAMVANRVAAPSARLVLAMSLFLLSAQESFADHVDPSFINDGSNHRHQCDPGSYKNYRRRVLHTSLFATPILSSPPSSHQVRVDETLRPKRRAGSTGDTGGHGKLNLSSIILYPVPLQYSSTTVPGTVVLQ